jgi:hypothetical protein
MLLKAFRIENNNLKQGCCVYVVRGDFARIEGGLN